MFRVPVHVMDLSSVPVNVTRDLAIVLTVGKSKIWSGVQSIMIGDKLPAPATVGAVDIVGVRSPEAP